MTPPQRWFRENRGALGFGLFALLCLALVLVAAYG